MASRATAYRPVMPAARGETRRFPADAARVAVRGQDGETIDAALVEVSIYGCRVACDIAHSPDEPVWLRLAGSLPIAARGVWCDGGFIGCRFDAPIGRPLLRSLTIRTS